MRFIFRADASKEIGSGHVMRSSVLAEEAISRGHEAIFVGVISGLDWVSSRINSLGFSSIVREEKEIVANPSTDILILDSYEISKNSPFLSPGNWKYVLTVSDAFTPEYNTNAALRPGLELLENTTSGPIILSGPDFILTRVGITKSQRIESEVGSLRVMVVGGGSDPSDFVREITTAISDLELDVELHCFTNNALALSQNLHIFRHPIGPELDFWANEVDLVLTTASTTCLEFIAREIPIGVVCAFDNQRDYYDQFGRLGFVSQLGILEPAGQWRFNLDELIDLLSSTEKRSNLRKASKGLIDLKGASRVIDFLEDAGSESEDC